MLDLLLKDFILVFALNVVRVSCFFGFRQWFAVRGTDSFGIQTKRYLGGFLRGMAAFAAPRLESLS